MNDDTRDLAELARAADGYTYYHSTPHDLSGESHIMPPSASGAEENFTNDEDRVYMTKSLDDAHEWGKHISGDDNYHVYQVRPRGEPDDDGDGVYSSEDRAEIVKRVHPPTQATGNGGTS
jgi:hypothetical protein